jgi:Radical SAM superfamily
MKILILDCLTTGDGNRKFSRDFIGAGPRYIAGFIEEISQQKFTTKIIRWENFLEQPKQLLKKFRILCISAMTMDYGAVQIALNEWKKVHPDPSQRFSIIGGPITSDPKITRKIDIDVAITGEAENSLFALFSENSSKLEMIYNNNLKSKKNQAKLQLWKYNLIKNIPNVSFLDKETEQIINTDHNTSNNWFKNTSGYPKKIKQYDDYKFARIFVECLRGCSNYRRTSIELNNHIECENETCHICRDSDFSTRFDNCPSNVPAGCGFCSTISTFGSPKSRKIENVIKEITELIKIGVTRIVLGGPGFLDFHRNSSESNPLINPTYPEPNYQKLLTLIDQLLEIPEIKNKQVQIFIENIKAGLCTERALQIISKIPNAIFSIGCETGSTEFSDMLGRPCSPIDTLTAVKKALALKIRIHVYFIHSLPADNEIYAKETLDLIKQFTELGIDKITLYKFRELPGSPFYKIHSKFKRFSKKTNQFYSKIKKLVIGFNRSQKNQLIGRQLKIILVEVNKLNNQDSIGWILEGGPKVSVKNSSQFLGQMRNVRITRVISDKLLEGFIIDN